MLKKLLCFALVAAISLCASVCAYAEPETASEIDASAQTFESAVDPLTTEITGSFSRTAECKFVDGQIYNKASGRVNDGTDATITIVLTLQKKVLFLWTDVTSWTTTGTNHVITSVKYYNSSASGTYRAKAKITFTKNGSSDTDTVYSSSISR